MKNCRKCQEYIPNSIVINGRKKNLQNRKFCLKCSPFGKHNTSQYDPIKRIKKGKYSDWTEKGKEMLRQCTYKRGLIRKAKLVKIKGGKCKLCRLLQVYEMHDISSYKSRK